MTQPAGLRWHRDWTLATLRRRSPAWVLTCVLAGCAPGLPTYSTAFPEQREDLHIDRLPVDVIDLAGIVEGVVAVSPGNTGGKQGVSVAGDDMRVQWTGGACESRVRVIVRALEEGFGVHVDSDSSLGGMLGCPAVGVTRALRIDLTQAIDGQLIRLTQEY